MRGLLVLIPVGCDGRPSEMVGRTLDGRTLLQRAVEQAGEVRPDRILVSLPAAGSPRTAAVCGVDGLRRPAGRDALEDALEHALDQAPAAADAGGRILCLDPLLPLRRAGRLAEALAQARRERADCVFSCHRESALLWRRSPMGLVPYFDPARPVPVPHEDADLPWLREDGGFYLLTAGAFVRTRCRHGGRLSPLETTPQEAVVADGPAGLAVCRALLAERLRGGRIAAAGAG